MRTLSIKEIAESLKDKSLIIRLQGNSFILYNLGTEPNHLLVNYHPKRYLKVKRVPRKYKVLYLLKTALNFFDNGLIKASRESNPPFRFSDIEFWEVPNVDISLLSSTKNITDFIKNEGVRSKEITDFLWGLDKLPLRSILLISEYRLFVKRGASGSLGIGDGLNRKTSSLDLPSLETLNFVCGVYEVNPWTLLMFLSIYLNPDYGIKVFESEAEYLRYYFANKLANS